MIVFRYLSRQLLQAMAAVTLVLLVVALTGRFIQYLGQAVAGELATDALFLLIIFRLPDFLLVIVPLAFFLSILLVYGRMYAENEMVVLIASGFSERKLVRMSLGFAALVMFLVGSLSLVLAPWGVRKTEELLQAQKNLTEVDLIVAGQFQSFGGGARVTHAERVSTSDAGERQLQGVFVATGADAAPRILIAERARPVVEPDGSRFMQLSNVAQYDGSPWRRRLHGEPFTNPVGQTPRCSRARAYSRRRNAVHSGISWQRRPRPHRRIAVAYCDTPARADTHAYRRATKPSWPKAGTLFSSRASRFALCDLLCAAAVLPRCDFGGRIISVPGYVVGSRSVSFYCSRGKWFS